MLLQHREIVWLLAARLSKTPAKLAVELLEMDSLSAICKEMASRFFGLVIPEPSEVVSINMLNGWLKNYDLPLPWLFSYWSFLLGTTVGVDAVGLQDVDGSIVTHAEMQTMYSEAAKTKNANVILISLLRLAPLYRYRIMECITAPTRVLTEYHRDDAWLKAVAAQPKQRISLRRGEVILGELVAFGGRCFMIANDINVMIAIHDDLASFLILQDLGRARARMVGDLPELEWVELFGEVVSVAGLEALKN